jgi:type IV pilus assembly protein PilC
MTTFNYVARDNSGSEVTGVLVAADIDEVIAKLHSQGMAVLHVAEDKYRERRTALSTYWAIFLRGRASTRDLALFSRQLSTVIESGIPLVKGLRGLAKDETGGVMSKAIKDLSVRLERGESLSDAMNAHPEVFNDMYVSMIRAGERAGTLDKIIEDLANYLENVDTIKTKVKSAMSYPTFILAFTVIATLFLIIQVVPTFSGIYEELGQELPMMTQMVLKVSDVIRGNAGISIITALTIVTAIFLALRTRQGKYTWDNMLMKMPIFGPIVTKSIMSRFARTFGILIGSGLPILETLNLVKGAVDNSVVSEAVADARRNIAAGHPVTASFRATNKFPEMILQLMSTGEEAGELDVMLAKGSDFYDRQVEASVHSISSLIEPVMIVLVGSIIGFIVVSMFLPIFGLGDAMLKGAAQM